MSAANPFSIVTPQAVPEAGFQEETWNSLINLQDQLNQRDTSVQNSIAAVQASLLTVVPAGCIFPYGKATAPTGYLLCDGSVVSQATYATLYAVIGATFGSDAGGNFTLPDFRRRVPLGAGGTAVVAPTNALGAVGGAETNTLDLTQIPSHSHGVLLNNSANGATGAWGTTSGVTPLATTSVGGGLAHNNVQPSLVVAFIIKT